MYDWTIYVRLSVFNSYHDTIVIKSNLLSTIAQQFSTFMARHGDSNGEEVLVILLLVIRISMHYDIVALILRFILTA